MFASRVSGTLEVLGTPHYNRRIAGQQESRFGGCSQRNGFKPEAAGIKSMSASHNLPRKLALLALLLAPPLATLPEALGLSCLAATPEVSQRTPAKPKAASAPAQEPPMPFRVGETLTYRVAWAAFSDAASLQLAIPERRNFYGWATWHFRSVAHTVSPVRTLFSVDDQFDSYTDASTLESRRFEMHLDELGRKQDQALHFVVTGQASRAPGTAVIVPPGTRDPLGALYALRGVDWGRTPEFRAPVYDGRDLYEMRARRQGPKEAVTVAAGRFTASRIVIQVFQYEREVSAIHFLLWLADDAARTPVLMQAGLPFGNLRAELLAVAH
jgi:hypothetical protein